MSKYIRTESGIIYVGDLIKDEYGNYCDPKNYETDMEVSNEYIIKEADTIEELCDCLMFVDNDEKQDFLITGVDEINITYSENETCYACLKIKLPNGAIRIEPVAKLNDKWWFELL